MEPMYGRDVIRKALTNTISSVMKVKHEKVTYHVDLLIQLKYYLSVCHICGRRSKYMNILIP